MEININLSNEKSLRDCVSKLKKLKLGQEFDNEVTNRLIDTCYVKCLENLEAMKIYPNTKFRAVKKSITKTSAKNGAGSVNIGYPAIMVEFGTGLIGASSRNEIADKIGFSDTHDGYAGWVYETDESASNPYKWQDKKGNWLGFTHGMEARPFAYNASLYIRQIAKEEVIRAIKEKIGK